MASTTGTLLIEIGANLARLQNDMGKAVHIVRKATDQITAAFSAIGAGVGIAGLGAMAKEAIDLGSKLSDMGKKYGVSAAELSKLSYGAKMNGVELETLGNSFKFLNKAIAESANPTSDAARAFSELGISTAELEKMKPQEVFELIADKMSELNDGANKSAIQLAIFGRAGLDILPMMDEGAAGIRKMKDEAVNLGIALDENTINSLDAAGDAIDRMKMRIVSWTGKAIIMLEKLWEIRKAARAAWMQNERPESATVGADAEAMGVSAWGPAKRDARSISGKTDTKKTGKGKEQFTFADQMETIRAQYSGAIEALDALEKAEAEYWAPQKQQAEEFAAAFGAMTQERIDGIESIASMDAEATKRSIEQQQEWNAVYQQSVELSDMYRTAWLDANLAIVDSMRQLYGGLQGWMSSTIQGIVEGTLTAKDAVKGLGTMLLSIISDYVAKWVVSRLFMAAFEKAAAVEQIAVSVATGSAVAAAWAPAAALASLATFGGNAAPAMAGLSSTVALAKVLSIPALAEGGVVSSPTIALVGEKGPEKITPLDESGPGVIQLMLDGDMLATWINRNAGRYGRIQLVPA